MATDQPKEPDDSVQSGASTPRPNEGHPSGSKDRRQQRRVPEQGKGDEGGRGRAKGLGPASGDGGQKWASAPQRPAARHGRSSAAPGQARSGGPSLTGSGAKPPRETAASAGGLSKGGSPGTGSSGRGAKSLGRPGDRRGAGTPSTPGTGGTFGSPGSKPFADQAAQAAPGTQGVPGAESPAAGSTESAGASEASETAGKAGGAKQALDAAGKSTDGMAANAAGDAAKKAVGGDGSSKGRDAAGRYAGAATSGAVAGASKGGLHGAAVGAAKNVAAEGGKDAIEGAGKITGGGPVAEPADKRLGAGGTSYERGGSDQDGESSGAKTAKRMAVGGAAAAAPPAMGLAMLLALVAWLKSMFFMTAALAANLGNLFLQFLVGAAKVALGFLTKPFVAVGGFFAKAAGAVFGTAVAATVAPVAAVGSGVVATVMATALIGSLFSGVLNQTAVNDGHVDQGWANCVVNASYGNGSGSQVPAGTAQNAQKVYSVLKTWGMPDENIAGILGNWSQESGIDPTSVEGIYNEPYKIGPRKQAAWDGNFTHIPGQSHGGIGLGQWSNGRTPMLLDYAKSKGKDWYTVEMQLAFMVEGDNPSDVAVFKDMIKTSQGSPGEAARRFHDNWERSADNASMMQERVQDAEMWMSKMSGWSVDDSVSGGIEDIVGGVIDVVGGGINTILGTCDNKSAGNVGLVDGGMNQEQAQELIDLYNEEGDKFLDQKYGPGGGPGSCGSNHAMNCVSFSTYFVNKYTTFDQYPSGNGIRTAYTIAEMTGKQMQDNPTPYSVGSGPASGPAGHTFAVLGVQGDKVIVGEAGYCAYMGRVSVRSASELKAAGWKFVDVSDLVKDGGDLPVAKA